MGKEVDVGGRGRILAVLCSDLHLSAAGPAGRSEGDWFAVMDGVLGCLRRLMDEHRCVLLCAGDIFHGWRSTAELINWAAEALPRPLYAVAGQHDLPYHRWEDLRKSAYWTLKLMGVLNDCSGGPRWVEVDGGGGFWLWGYPWGWRMDDSTGVSESSKDGLKGLRVALIHRFVWVGDKRFAGAGVKDHVSNLASWARGFDVVVSGDNHLNWKVRLGNTVWWNCGSLIRRNLSERRVDGRLRVGLLTDCGEVLERELPVEERWVADGGDVEFSVSGDKGRLDLTELIEGLTDSWEGMDVLDMLRRFSQTDKLSVGARRLLSEVLEEVHLRREGRSV